MKTLCAEYLKKKMWHIDFVKQEKIEVLFVYFFQNTSKKIIVHFS